MVARPAPPPTPYAELNDVLAELVSCMLVRWTVRERGVPLFGPAPESLIDPVPPAALRSEIHTVMHEWSGRPDPAASVRRVADPNEFALTLQLMEYALALMERFLSSAAPCRERADY